MQSIQVNITHKCAGCGALYVPYDLHVPCPRCGVVERQRCDFVSNAVRILLHNLEHHKTFLPDGWIAESFADYVLAVLLEIFHAYTASKTDKTFYEFSHEMLEDKVDLPRNTYLAGHMHTLAMRMYEELRQRSAKQFRPLTAYPTSPLRKTHFASPATTRYS
jgi:hypothetical protein